MAIESKEVNPLVDSDLCRDKWLNRDCCINEQPCGSGGDPGGDIHVAGEGSCWRLD